MAWVFSTHGDWWYVKLMGIKHRVDAVKLAFAGRPRDESLKLVREPTNEHDPNAIGVFNRDVLIGYIPRELAAKLAPRMDNKEKFMCLIVDSNPRRPCIRIKPYPIRELPEEG